MHIYSRKMLFIKEIITFSYELLQKYAFSTSYQKQKSYKKDVIKVENQWKI